MQVVNLQQILGKKVLLRLDIDVPLRQAQGKLEVVEDFRLRAGIPTLKLCLEHAQEVIVIGHIGRPEGRVVEELKVAPVIDWFKSQGFSGELESGKLKVLENLRFDPREEAGDESLAKELAGMGGVYVNEAFASYHPAVSTTVLPTLLPHFAGLRFAKEVEVLTNVRENPQKPFVAIMGGAKVKDKLPVINVLAGKADAVLVGGKLVKEFQSSNFKVQSNILIGKLTEDGLDIAPETVEAWNGIISKAAMIVWNGPIGKIQNSNVKIQNFEDMGSERGTYEIAKMVLESKAELVVGGGDTVGFLGQVGLLEEFETKGFVSTGGGAMLKFLTDGTLPTIEALS